MGPDPGVFVDENPPISSTSSKKSTPSKLPICPPTLQRRPRWADGAPATTGLLERRSSLSANKVLLTLEGNRKHKEHLFSDFENVGWLGSGQFAEVYKMKS